MKFLFALFLLLFSISAMYGIGSGGGAKGVGGGGGGSSSASSSYSTETEKQPSTTSETEKESKESDKKGDKEKEDKKKEEEKKKKEEEPPWFMGTFLAFYGQNVDPGKLSVQPYLFMSRRYGIYDQHSHLISNRNTHIYSGILTFETGITKTVDIELELFGFYIHKSQGSAFHLGDLRLFLGFQLARDKKGTWIPDLRILVGQSLPTGHYKNLSKKLQVDEATGSGAYETTLVLVVKKIFYTWPKHPYNWTFNVITTHSSKVDVEGFNTYGGDPSTQGTIQPSENFIFDLAFEYKFDKNWGWGIDVNYVYQNSFSFHQDTPDPFKGAASSSLLTLFPELEYNFSEIFGAAVGVWFSVAGRNSFAFYAGAATVYYLF